MEVVYESSMEYIYRKMYFFEFAHLQITPNLSYTFSYVIKFLFNRRVCIHQIHRAHGLDILKVADCLAHGANDSYEI